MNPRTTVYARDIKTLADFPEPLSKLVEKDVDQLLLLYPKIKEHFPDMQISVSDLTGVGILDDSTMLTIDMTYLHIMPNRYNPVVYAAMQAEERLNMYERQGKIKFPEFPSIEFLYCSNDRSSVTNVNIHDLMTEHADTMQDVARLVGRYNHAKELYTKDIMWLRALIVAGCKVEMMNIQKSGEIGIPIGVPVRLMNGEASESPWAGITSFNWRVDEFETRVDFFTHFICPDYSFADKVGLGAETEAPGTLIALLMKKYGTYDSALEVKTSEDVTRVMAVMNFLGLASATPSDGPYPRGNKWLVRPMELKCLTKPVATLIPGVYVPHEYDPRDPEGIVENQEKTRITQLKSLIKNYL